MQRRALLACFALGSRRHARSPIEPTHGTARPLARRATRPRAESLSKAHAHTKFNIVTRRHRILYQKNLMQRALLERTGAPRTKPAKAIVIRPTTPLGAVSTSRMARNRGGASLLEDSPTRASPEPQVRPLAPCFTVRSLERDITPGIVAPDCPGGFLIDDALEGRRAQ